MTNNFFISVSSYLIVTIIVPVSGGDGGDGGSDGDDDNVAGDADDVLPDEPAPTGAGGTSDRRPTVTGSTTPP
jgi:hypothetical protein